MIYWMFLLKKSVLHSYSGTIGENGEWKNNYEVNGCTYPKIEAVRVECANYSLQEFVLKKMLARKEAINVGKGEVKIAVMISYFIILGVMGWVVTIRTTSIFSSTDFQEYLICESSGKTANCTMAASIVALYIIITFIILSFVPVMSLLMTFDPHVFKKSK